MSSVLLAKALTRDTDEILSHDVYGLAFAEAKGGHDHWGPSLTARAGMRVSLDQMGSN